MRVGRERDAVGLRGRGQPAQGVGAQHGIARLPGRAQQVFRADAEVHPGQAAGRAGSVRFHAGEVGGQEKRGHRAGFGVMGIHQQRRAGLGADPGPAALDSPGTAFRMGQEGGPAAGEIQRLRRIGGGGRSLPFGAGCAQLADRRRGAPGGGQRGRQRRPRRGQDFDHRQDGGGLLLRAAERIQAGLRYRGMRGGVLGQGGEPARMRQPAGGHARGRGPGEGHRARILMRIKVHT
ncbi:hypothetical protein WJ976_10775 [Achromobacter denitrificans]